MGLQNVQTEPSRGGTFLECVMSLFISYLLFYKIIFNQIKFRKFLLFFFFFFLLSQMYKPDLQIIKYLLFNCGKNCYRTHAGDYATK